MPKVEIKEVREAENSIRDFKNWLSVFKTEYDVAEEALKVLQEKVADLATKVGSIKCSSKGVDASSVKPASNTLRDTKGWLAVFAKEYDLPEEAVKVLHSELDKVGGKLGQIKCS
ncbi:hypothetical protein HY489_06725 [Candidatus Woesearchaeota archaeon]|nr:hypothetical protein [Candidatus Woesearchaeota archaeon]